MLVVPELVQLMSVAVVVQTNCADAGELAARAMAESVVAPQIAAARVILMSVNECKSKLRTVPPRKVSSIPRRNDSTFSTAKFARL